MHAAVGETGLIKFGNDTLYNILLQKLLPFLDKRWSTFIGLRRALGAGPLEGGRDRLGIVHPPNIKGID